MDRSHDARLRRAIACIQFTNRDAAALTVTRSNFGFDPLELGKEPASLKRFQEAELQHSRWAMLGARQPRSLPAPCRITVPSSARNVNICAVLRRCAFYAAIPVYPL